MPRFDDLLVGVTQRHKAVDLSLFPWFKRAAVVRIAIYCEGSIQFSGGSFDGLDRVVASLTADPWTWVKFEVSKFHRGTDPSIPAANTNKTLDAIGLTGFDELWLFGVSEGNLLSAAETAAVNAFMDAGGGLLHTGDHASLGQGIAGSIKRAGAMRQYPAPAAAPGVWNSTLRPGSNGTYEFPDQSDDVPQSIRLRTYPIWRYRPWLSLQRRPHPVLCGANGPIKVFPDHQHEGEAIAPTSYPAADWPTNASGAQQKVEVIAWGKIEDPNADVGREVGLVSTYDGHQAKVGRIVADSTWHHWFDINLDGFDTPAGQTHLAEFERYFQNVAAWLAPARKQQQMRTGLIWFVAWRDPLVMLDPRQIPVSIYGGTAIDALGQHAPQCLVADWLINLVPIKMLEPLRPHFAPIEGITGDKEQREAMAEDAAPLPVLEAIAAAVAGSVYEVVRKAGQPSAKDVSAIERALAESPRAAMALLQEESNKYARAATRVSEMVKTF